MTEQHLSRVLWIALIFALVGSWFPRRSMGGTENDVGPHGGQVVNQSSERVEVKTDASRGAVDVYFLRPRKGPPSEVSLSLWKNEGSQVEVDLKPAPPPMGAGAEAIPHYQGELNPAAGSFVGFELKFRRPEESAVRLRSAFLRRK